MARNFRDLITYDLPAWLTRGEGGKLAYLCALLVDVGIERVRQALEIRMPSRTGDTGLARLAIDRGLVRGREESRENFAARLQQWRYPRGHRVRGNAFALLDQVSAYFGGAGCYVIDALGNQSLLTSGGERTSEHGVEWPWATYPEGERRRFWIVVDSTGLSISGADIDAIRRLLSWRAWKPAGTRAEWLIFAPGMTVDPDGWNRWSYNDSGTQRPLVDGVVMASLDEEFNNYYTGDSTNWPYATELPGPSDYTGNSTNWPYAIVTPDGAAYAPDPSNWQTSIRLFDDGDGI